MKYFSFLQKSYSPDPKHLDFNGITGPFNDNEEIRQYILNTFPGQRKKILIFEAEEITEIIPPVNDEEMRIALDLAANNTLSKGNGDYYIPQGFYSVDIFQALKVGKIRELAEQFEVLKNKR